MKGRPVTTTAWPLTRPFDLSVCLSRDALRSQSQFYSHRSTWAASRASSRGAGRRRTATGGNGAGQCVLNQTANGALCGVAQRRHRRSLLSERHRLSQHTSQYKQTKFSMRYIHIVSVVTLLRHWPLIIIFFCHCCITKCHYAFFIQQKGTSYVDTISFRLSVCLCPRAPGSSTKAFIGFSRSTAVLY
jgi:hypothetical protein